MGGWHGPLLDAEQLPTASCLGSACRALSAKDCCVKQYVLTACALHGEC